MDLHDAEENKEADLATEAETVNSLQDEGAPSAAYFDESTGNAAQAHSEGECHE